MSLRDPRVMLDLSLVEIGCCVWERIDDLADYTPRGGIVVAISRLVDPVDPDGLAYEVQRRFLCARFWRGDIHYDLLRADQVGSMEPSNVASVRALWRAMAGVVSKKRGTATPRELELVAHMSALVRSTCGS